MHLVSLHHTVILLSMYYDMYVCIIKVFDKMELDWVMCRKCYFYLMQF